MDSVPRLCASEDSPWLLDMADHVERAGTYALAYLAVVQHWNVVCPDDKRSEACPRRRGWRRGEVARALDRGTIPDGLHPRSPLLAISQGARAAQAESSK